MATVQLGVSLGERREQVGVATGGSAPTDTLEVNIKTGQRKADVLVMLEHIKQTVIQSTVFL